MEVWTPYDGPYFMRYADAEAGRLVRLAHVVRWLMQSLELPRVQAVERMCSAIEAASAKPELFLVQPSNYATVAPVDCAYGGATASQIEALKKKAAEDARQRDHKQRERWGGSWASEGVLRMSGGKITTALPALVEPGLPAALWNIRHWWGNAKQENAILDAPKKIASTMAVRLADAARLWGYGVVTQAAGVAMPTEYTGDWLKARQAQIMATGTRNHMQVLVKETGVPERDIRRLIERATKATPAQPSNIKAIGNALTGSQRKRKA